MEIAFPYGEKEIPIDIPEKNVLVVAKAKEKKAGNENEIIENALENPLHSRKLEQLHGRTVIVVDDKTRPLPVKKILPHVLERVAGEVTIMFATGTHAPMNERDAEQVLGKEIMETCEWMSHSQDARFVNYGMTRLGTPLFFNAAYADAEVKITVGDIEYHYFAGYGGGRKSVLPGVASESTVQANHKRMFHENSRFGTLEGNPVHEDMEEGAEKVGIDFCLNVVMNSAHEIVDAHAGDHRTVLREGAKLIDEMYRVSVAEQADAAVIAADGHPHDINLYQAMKAIQTVIDVVKGDGTIILLAECRDGHGSEKFYNAMETYDTSNEIKRDLMDNFVMGKHKVYYMLKAAEKVKLYAITDMEDEMASHFKMEKIGKDEVLDTIYRRHGENARIIASPHATTTLVCRE